MRNDLKEAILYPFCFFRRLHTRWYVRGKGYNNFPNSKTSEKKIYRKRSRELNDNEKHGKTNTSKAKACEWTLREMNTPNSNEHTLPTTFGLNRQKDAWLFNIPLTSFPSAISQSKVTMAKTTPWYTCSLGYKLLRRVRPVARPLSQFSFFLHSCWVRLFKIP